MTSTAGTSVRRAAAPSPDLVVLLQSISTYPPVSVLLTTTPADTMTVRDEAALRGLAASAVERLESERLPETPAVVASLQRLVDEAASGHTSAGLALYVTADMALAVRLPVTVRDRVVIDPTFATRDLMRALHQAPRHVVLVLTGREARLFDGVGDGLRPAARSAFPLQDTRPPRQRDPRRRSDRDTDAFYRVVDRALGTYLRLHPAPLVLVGSDRAVAGFTALSKNLSRLAGAVHANVATAPLPDLAARIRPVLDAYLHSRQQEALDLVDRRAGTAQVVTGMQSCWLAARHEDVEMLAVEDSLFYPARLSGDGDLLLPADDVEHPDVIDDAVDELIELVLARGGWIALVDEGRLAGQDRVALTLRSPH